MTCLSNFDWAVRTPTPTPKSPAKTRPSSFEDGTLAMVPEYGPLFHSIASTLEGVGRSQEGILMLHKLQQQDQNPQSDQGGSLLLIFFSFFITSSQIFTL